MRTVFVLLILIHYIWAQPLFISNSDSVLITSDSFSTKNQIFQIESTTPLAEFTYAKNNGDYRFIGTQGYSLVFPGTSLTVDDTILKTYGYKILRGISDVIQGDSGVKLFVVGNEFAGAYNQLLLVNIIKADSVAKSYMKPIPNYRELLNREPKKNRHRNQ